MQEENINKKAIKKTIQSLKSEKGLRFRMDKYKTACGTAGCIGGHVVHSNNPEKYQSLNQEDIYERAIKILNITEDTAEDLFSPDPKYANIFVNNPDEDLYVGKYRAIKALEMLHDDEILDWSKIPPEWKLKKNDG